MKGVRILLSLLFVTGACVLPAVSQSRPTRLSDATIKGIVEQRLISHHLLREDNIQVSVEDQIVTLRGTVRSLLEKRRAEREAQGVDDVARVVNELTIEASGRADQQIADDVARAMRNYVFFDIFDWVDGEVKEGIVTLRGWVHQPWHKSEYESRAESVVGVKQVKNEIQVLPSSIYDDQLRIAAARLIYSHPGFERYAIQPYPPIHIIVENGKVVLKGVISSQVDRQLAEEIVRSRVLAFDVINDLTVAGEKPRR